MNRRENGVNQSVNFAVDGTQVIVDVVIIVVVIKESRDDIICLAFQELQQLRIGESRPPPWRKGTCYCYCGGRPQPVGDIRARERRDPYKMKEGLKERDREREKV